MKASVIIPTYNRTKFFLDALKSVREQDFPLTDYEIVMVDNASRPMRELAGLHQPLGVPVMRYVHEPATGLHDARHAGARAAQGEILVYIDDDVLCPPGWLVAMVEPYRDPIVAMVAGKVELRYEGKPPDWLPQFQDMLSALDWGDNQQAVAPPRSPVGCNMSLRKSVLYSVGGFNPDAFSDRRLLRWRGDGECGLARKVHDAGLLVWYAPEAWLYHRVPASRMTPEYIKHRSALAGIEDAYTDLRYHQRSVPQLIFRCLACLAMCFYHSLNETLHRQQPERCLNHLAAASRYFHRGRQHWRQAKSPNLQRYTIQKTYLI